MLPVSLGRSSKGEGNAFHALRVSETYWKMGLKRTVNVCFYTRGVSVQDESFFLQCLYCHYNKQYCNDIVNGESDYPSLFF